MQTALGTAYANIDVYVCWQIGDAMNNAVAGFWLVKLLPAEGWLATSARPSRRTVACSEGSSKETASMSCTSWLHVKGALRKCPLKASNHVAKTC